MHSRSVGGYIQAVGFQTDGFGTFAETSSNVRDFVATTVEYGLNHLGGTITATTVDAVRMALRKRYRTQLGMAAWRGYVNLVLDRITYVGTWTTGSNKARVRHETRERADVGEFEGIWMTHETDEPTRVAFPNRWGNIGRGCSRLGLDISVSN